MDIAITEVNASAVACGGGGFVVLYGGRMCASHRAVGDGHRAVCQIEAATRTCGGIVVDGGIVVHVNANLGGRTVIGISEGGGIHIDTAAINGLVVFNKHLLGASRYTDNDIHVLWLYMIRCITWVAISIRGINGHAATLAGSDFVADDFTLVKIALYPEVGRLKVSLDKHATAVSSPGRVVFDFAAVQYKPESERSAVGGVPEVTSRAVKAVRVKIIKRAVFHSNTVDGHAAAVALSLVAFDDGGGV